MKKRILIVDDTAYSHIFEDMVIKSLMNEFDDVDIVIDKAYTISKALKMIHQNEEYNVVLSDMNLTDGRGSVIANAAKIKNTDTKTVAFTIYPNIIFEEERDQFDLLLCKLTTPELHKNNLLCLLGLSLMQKKSA